MILQYQKTERRGVYNYAIAFLDNKYINISLKTMILLKVILRFETMILQYQKYETGNQILIISYALSPIAQG